MEKRTTPMTADQEHRLKVILFAVYMRGGMNVKEDVMDYVNFVMEEVMQVLSDNKE